MAKREANGITAAQAQVLKLVRKGSKFTAKELLEKSRAKGGPQHIPTLMYHLRRLTDGGRLEIVSGGGKGREIQFRRVA